MSTVKTSPFFVPRARARRLATRRFVRLYGRQPPIAGA